VIIFIIMLLVLQQINESICEVALGYELDVCSIKRLRQRIDTWES